MSGRVEHYKVRKGSSVRNQVNRHFGFKNALWDSLREGVVLREGFEIKVRDVDKVSGVVRVKGQVKAATWSYNIWVSVDKWGEGERGEGEFTVGDSGVLHSCAVEGDGGAVGRGLGLWWVLKCFVYSEV